MTDLDGIEITEHDLSAEIFTPEAAAFVADLVRTFRNRRIELLRNRRIRQEEFDAGLRPDFLSETAEIRSGTWTVSPPPKDLLDRRVEITGPPERKMMINALNSGARVFMADFEDSSAPTWDNMLNGQVNVRDAIRRDLTLQRDGKSYAINDETATLVIRPRGWHLPERHVQIDGQPAAASLVDFGLVFFHNAREALNRGTAPYFYLPKLENHHEARLWNDVFCHAQDALGVPRGSIKATVLIETITAAFEMDEILYELREHSAGLNAGRWDYIFSVAKKFNADPAFVLPDRSDVTMTVPFMRAYTELMVATCHKRAAHAIGGMAAFIPNRRDPEVTAQALTKVKEDKRREANDGCDGTWVAHPDLVTVAEAEFNDILGKGLNQVDRQRPDVRSAGTIFYRSTNREGRSLVWPRDQRLRGPPLSRLVAIGNRCGGHSQSDGGRCHCRDQSGTDLAMDPPQSHLEDGTTVTRDLVRTTIDAQMAVIPDDLGSEVFASLPFEEARSVFEQVALASELSSSLPSPPTSSWTDGQSTSGHPPTTNSPPGAPKVSGPPRKRVSDAELLRQPGLGPGQGLEREPQMGGHDSRLHSG
ncbi:MAG: hypothetical protein CM1200mP26_23460 [Acidimicrobiales bacterium]|nr:MAG: hypothetical protein CM1200mP26_23460 [Acidimicrobiales bacterium]